MVEGPKTGTIKLYNWREFTKVMKIMGDGRWIFRGHKSVSYHPEMEDDAWRMLDQANINAATIYPDIDGIAKSVRYNDRILGLRGRQTLCDLKEGKLG